MSRDPPTRPNLEHLRKQAKRRLDEMRQQHPELQLADAQHALAREYGFASWPKLKAHVESLPLPSAPESRATLSPFAGTWMANVARSRQHPLNPFRSATMHFDVRGDDITITDVVEDETGRAERGENTIRADGIEHYSPRGNGYSLIAAWRGPFVLETLGKQEGKVIGQGRYEVADDGMRMTISGDQQLIVLDRLEERA
jgi:hypothetical protein